MAERRAQTADLDWMRERLARIHRMIVRTERGSRINDRLNDKLEIYARELGAALAKRGG